MLRSVLLVAACVFLLVDAARGQDSSALFAQGEQAFAAGEYREAVRLFRAALAAGSTGPSSYYNIGVSQYRSGDYAGAETTFAVLAAQFPALRELAEYNRGLALRASGRSDAARIAFDRARASTDEKIVALANAQLAELGQPSSAPERRWRGYFSGAMGYDDNVALIDELLLAVPRSSSSSFTDALGVATRKFSAPLRLDLTGYAVRYPDASEFDQTALRVALTTEQRLGAWTLAFGPTLGRSTLDSDVFERIFGLDLRLRRIISERLAFELRAVYDDASAGETRFGYIEGSRKQLRFAVEHVARARFRVGLDLERNERADPGVSPSRQRWFVAYQRRLAGEWTGDARISYRDSRYHDASIPRDERLTELSLAARRDLRAEWTFGAELRWLENDSTVPLYSYDAERVSLSLGRGF